MTILLPRCFNLSINSFTRASRSAIKLFSCSFSVINFRCFSSSSLLNCCVVAFDPWPPVELVVECSLLFDDDNGWSRPRIMQRIFGRNIKPNETKQHRMMAIEAKAKSASWFRSIINVNDAEIRQTIYKERSKAKGENRLVDSQRYCRYTCERDVRRWSFRFYSLEFRSSDKFRWRSECPWSNRRDRSRSCVVSIGTVETGKQFSHRWRLDFHALLRIENLADLSNTKQRKQWNRWVINCQW